MIHKNRSRAIRIRSRAFALGMLPINTVEKHNIYKYTLNGYQSCRRLTVKYSWEEMALKSRSLLGCSNTNNVLNMIILRCT